MSENINSVDSPLNDKTVQAQLSKKIEDEIIQKFAKKYKPRLAKIPLFFAILAIAGSGYLAYQGFYGKFGVRQQQLFNQAQTARINSLSQQNASLQDGLTALQAEQAILHDEIKQLSPSQASLVLTQLNSLISGANQSLILYHDTAAAIKLLSYAKQVLAASDDPVFSELKINLAKDLDSLQAVNNFDNTMLAAQLDDLSKLAVHLRITIIESAGATSETKNISLWGKFIANAKSSLLGLVTVAKTNPNAVSALLPGNQQLIHQHLQLDLQGARQALLSHNQELWNSSLSNAESILHQYFVNDTTSQKELFILGQLNSVKFANATANLDLTMQALLRLGQLNSGK